jgi:hypothetical protein
MRRLLVVLVIAALAVLGGAATQSSAAHSGMKNPYGLPLPKVRTTAAIGVAGTEAVVGGVINADDQPTHFRFQYGLTTSYGMTTEVNEEVVTGHFNTNVAEALSGLRPRSTYHYRIIGLNRFGSVHGNDRTFRTTGKHS